MSFQCVHLSEVYDDVDTGATGRFHPRIQTGVPVAMLALLRECIHHFPLPWPGENPPMWFHIVCCFPDGENSKNESNAFNSNDLCLCFQVICVVFVCAAFTLDIFCLIFVPLHWLFFVASTYVLFNYIWHTGEFDDCLFCVGFFPMHMTEYAKLCSTHEN